MSPMSQVSLSQTMQAVMEESQYLPEAEVTVTTEELTEDDRHEVLAFLSERPMHTVCLTGFIRDNGLQSPHNRGTFYGCRNSAGRLEGVALIGHATLIEARTRRAMREFALVAQGATRTHMIMGEKAKVEQFWNYYADEGQQMRRACRESLFELRRAMEQTLEVEGLRLATCEDIDLVAPVHASMAEEESGVNPLNVDPEGFIRRCLRRIEMQRVWVVVRDGELLFKADVQADTPEVVYLEGVWVNSAERGTGLGRECLRQLCREVMVRSKSVCVLVNEENERAQTFYRMCNFKLRATYDTIFLARGERSH